MRIYKDMEEISSKINQIILSKSNEDLEKIYNNFFNDSDNEKNITSHPILLYEYIREYLDYTQKQNNFEGNQKSTIRNFPLNPYICEYVEYINSQINQTKLIRETYNDTNILTSQFLDKLAYIKTFIGDQVTFVENNVKI
jgi:hypothetical protein